MFAKIFSKISFLCDEEVKQTINISYVQSRKESNIVDFLFQESLFYTSIPLKRNVSARISLRGLRSLIWSIHYVEAIMLLSRGMTHII